MLTLARRLSVTRHDSPLARWELVSADIDPALRDHVVSWCGFTEWTPMASRRREVPSGIVPLIVDFGGAYRVASARDPHSWLTTRLGFAAGMHDSSALTESIGTATAMQVNFTPLGAYAFFGRPMSELTNRVVALDDLFGRAADRLVEQLYEAREWEVRFDLLETFLKQRLFAPPRLTTASPGVVWAWQQLTRSAGQIEIGALASALGCSRKHLIAQFHRQIGLPPKTAARILRFDRAVHLINRRPDLSGADVAQACGYFDQPHFNKEFRQFAGVTPSDFMRHRLPELNGIAAD